MSYAQVYVKMLPIVLLGSEIEASDGKIFPNVSRNRAKKIKERTEKKRNHRDRGGRKLRPYLRFAPSARILKERSRGKNRFLGETWQTG